MSQTKLRWIAAFTILVALVGGCVSLNSYLEERALHALPYGFKKFSLSDPLPECARWKEHMPSTRAPV